MNFYDGGGGDTSTNHSKQGAQVVLSLLGLTFSHENEGAVRYSPGTVNASRLNTFYLSPSISQPSFDQENYLAHQYGEISVILGEQVEGGPIPIELDDSMVYILYQNKTNSFKYYVCTLYIFPP